MPSRINTDYWGAENTWQWLDNNDRLKVIKISQYCASNPFGYNQEALLNKGKYEDSVCVWGAPADCSIVSNTTVSIWGDGGILAYEVKEPRPRNVVPLSIQASPVSATAIGYYLANVSYINSGMYNHRCSGDVTMQSITGQYNIGNATAHYNFFFNTKRSGATLDTQLGAQATYWDYRGVVYRPNITLRPKKNINMSTSGLFVCNNIDNGFGQNWSDLKTAYSLEDEDIMVCGVSVTAHVGLKLNNADQNRGTLNSWNPLFYASGAMQPSTRAKDLFYTTDTADYGFLSCEYNNTIGFGATAVASNQSRGGSSYSALPSPTAFWNNSTQFQDSKNCDEMFRISRKKQVFDDVAYHWSVGVQYSMTGDATNKAIFKDIFDEGFSSVGVNFSYFTMIPYIVIDDAKGNGYKQALINAIAHEVSFYGFPFCMLSANIDTEVWDANSENILIPRFDEHMITTGDYCTLKKAYAEYLPQSVWHNIFGEQSIYDYDPEYNYPEPGPGDVGDLDNQQLHSLRYNGSNNYYLLTEAELSQFIGFINGLYAGESDPDKQRAIDFMGSNPTDYIVGIYGTGIELTGGATTSIKLGAVDTADAGIFGRAVPTNLTYVNFGNYDIPALNNFLDFKPYTTIEVYVPLCGTVEVDPADYVGHNLKVDGLIDYQTGELTARIIRDGKTVTNTLSGSMWVQLPVTAAKMGDYQNNQHQLRMQMLSSVLSFGQSSANALNSDAQNAASAIAGSVAGGSPSGSMGSIGKAQFTIPQNAANTALSLYNTHYQITHTQPARAVASSASSGNALEMYHHAMVFIKRPVFLDGYNAEEYAHTIGHACCISDKLSSFEGYTVAAAADLDNVHTKSVISPLQATAQEKQLLKQALQAGIYINTISPE